MALSESLKSQFAKAMNASDIPALDYTELTGTAVEYGGDMYIQFDGSDQLTPAEDKVTGIKDGDRIIVKVKNHSAIITGNLSDPAAGTTYVEGLESQVADFNTIVAQKADIELLEAERARIDELVAENVTITGKLEAAEADIGDLEADNVTINEKLTAVEGDIEYLHSTKLDADEADIRYATIDQLNATNADIDNLQGDYGEFKELVADDFEAVNATITNLDNKYANIDFSNIGEAAIEKLFADSGIIGDLVMDEGHVTGTLVGVTIKGDLIEGGTVVADKLVILGDDGLYYKLNTNGETIAAEQTEYNSLNGTIITAKSITAEKINVSDLVAFDATIGGFNITNDSLYSGVKSSVMNTTRGIYMNNDGEISLGNARNYLRFYKASDGTYKLAISAESLTFAATGTSIDDAISDAEKVATNYLKFSSANGLVVSNHTASSLGANVQITSSGVNIRHNTTVYSSFTGSQVEFFAGGTSVLALTNKPDFRLGASSSHYLYANNTGFDIHQGSTVISSFHGSSITLGPTSGRNALINSSGLYLRSGTSNIAYFTASSARIYSGAGTDDYLHLSANRLEMFASGASRFVVTNGSTRIGNLDGRNACIDGDSFDIRNGTTILSNFSATTINLGNNSSTAKINFCASNAFITYDSDVGMVLQRTNGALNVIAATAARVRGTSQTTIGNTVGSSVTEIMCGATGGSIEIGNGNRPIKAYVGGAYHQLKRVYRLHNPYSDAYLTTADSSEANGLVDQGWTINTSNVYYAFK